MLCPVIMCSGAIVSSRNVLTTVFCVNYLSPEDVQVHARSNKYYSREFTFNVANIFQHPRFIPSTYDYNTAILTVETIFNFRIGTVQPIPLVTTAPPINSIVTVTTNGSSQSKFRFNRCTSES